jgi:hypothetical protein
MFGEAKRRVSDSFIPSYAFRDSVQLLLRCELLGLMARFDQGTLDILRVEWSRRDSLPSMTF